MVANHQDRPATVGDQPADVFVSPIRRAWRRSCQQKVIEPRPVQQSMLKLIVEIVRGRAEDEDSAVLPFKTGH